MDNGGKQSTRRESLVVVILYDNKLWFQPECTGSGSEDQVGPSPRAFYIAVAIDCHMFIFGGRYGSKRLGDFWVLDTDVWQWSELTSVGDLPLSRDFAAASAIGNRKIVIIRFWLDHWCADQSLKGTFLELFELVAYREASVGDMVVSHTLEEGWNWNIWFQCGFNEWEMELVGAFTRTLELLSPPIEGGDKMRLCLGSKGDFDIKSFYGALRASSSITFPWKSIWGVKAPCCVSFFVWTAAWGKEENETPGWTQLKLPGQAPSSHCSHTVTSGGHYLLLFGGHGTGGWLSRYDVYYSDCIVLDWGECLKTLLVGFLADMRWMCHHDVNERSILFML
ncbi:protein GLUTELIN PRECURSOR ACCUMULATION 3-like [Castanea sativa]|uniref:protein GLUTELIN PRECURSOR ACCUMULATION 3-like n=1 Tax=Castanea sativa TaxID=21020 RepID=UPI003F64B9A3